MSDAARVHEGCLNSRMVIAHEEQLKLLGPQISNIDKRLGEVREKLFNGYGEQIKQTNDKVDEIKEIVSDLSDRGGLEATEIENIVERKMLAMQKNDRRWIKSHRVEIMSLFTAVCVAIITIMRLFPNLFVGG